MATGKPKQLEENNFGMRYTLSFSGQFLLPAVHSIIIPFNIVHADSSAPILLNFPPFPGKMLWNGYTSGLCPGKTYFPDPLNPERIKVYWVLLLL